MLSGRLGDGVKIELGVTYNGGTVLKDSPDVVELTMPNLEENTGTIVTNNSKLQKLSLPNLKTSTGTIASGCSNLSVLELPELETCVNKTSFSTALHTYIPKLRYVTFQVSLYHGWAYFISNQYTSEISLDNFESINVSTGQYGLYLACFYMCTNLNKVTFSKKFSFNGEYHCDIKNIFHGCTSLYHIKMCGISYNGNFSDNINDTKLIKIELFDLHEDPLHIEWWCLGKIFYVDDSSLVSDKSICSNNLEQFLYNFREYIVKRLATVSQKTYIYLHETTKSYIEGDYAKSWTVPGESQTYYASLDLLLQEKNWGLA